VIDVRQHAHAADIKFSSCGVSQAEKCYHLGYGFVSLPEGAMSARKGRLMLFTDASSEATRRVLAEIEKKNPDMPAGDREHVASQIGLGALAYAMLSVDNNKDIVFDIEAALNFDGTRAHPNACPCEQHFAEGWRNFRGLAAAAGGRIRLFARNHENPDRLHFRFPPCRIT
jgi:arginyl-tRNA synthetase